ncbi:hypothetical protein MKW92_030186, partial [Papaver armeniacum]
TDDFNKEELAGLGSRYPLELVPIRHVVKKSLMQYHDNLESQNRNKIIKHVGGRIRVNTS